MTLTLTPTAIARQAFVAAQVAVIRASEHPQAQRWVTAVIRAGEAFQTRAGRAEMAARCAMYQTTVQECQCEAGQHGHPCKHRAFVRLIQKWEEE